MSHSIIGLLSDTSRGKFTLNTNIVEISFYNFKHINYQKYSDRFIVHVLDLTQIDLATEEDKALDLDRWAKLFNALTWEDFKMISADNKSMQEAGEALFTLNGDDRIRALCEAREDYRRTWDSVKLDMAEKDTVIAELELSNKKLEAQVAELQRQLQNSASVK